MPWNSRSTELLTISWPVAKLRSARLVIVWIGIWSDVPGPEMTKMSAGKIVCQYDDSAGATDMTILPRRNATMEARKMRLPGTRVMR